MVSRKENDKAGNHFPRVIWSIFHRFFFWKVFERYFTKRTEGSNHCKVHWQTKGPMGTPKKSGMRGRKKPLVVVVAFELRGMKRASVSSPTHNFRVMVHVIDIIESIIGLSAYRTFLSDLFDTSPLNALLFWSFFLVVITSIALIIQWISSILYHRKVLFFVWYRA